LGLEAAFAELREAAGSRAMTPKHRAHAGLAVLAGIVMACSPPLAELPTPGAVTREPGTATIPAPTTAPATPTPVAPPATATPEPTATATLVPFTEHLAGAAVGLGGQFRPDMASLTSVRLADNNIRRQFNELGIAPVMDAAGQAGVEICYYDGQCAVSLAAPNVFDGLELDPRSPNTNEMLAAYVNPATGQEAGYLVRRVVYEDAVDGVGRGANAEVGAKRDYVWGVQKNAAGQPVMVLVKVEDGEVRVVRPAYAFFPAVSNNPPEYNQDTETLKINGQTIVRGVEAEKLPEKIENLGVTFPESLANTQTDPELNFTVSLRISDSLSRGFRVDANRNGTIDPREELVLRFPEGRLIDVGLAILGTLQIHSERVGDLVVCDGREITDYGPYMSGVGYDDDWHKYRIINQGRQSMAGGGVSLWFVGNEGIKFGGRIDGLAINHVTEQEFRQFERVLSASLEPRLTCVSTHEYYGGPYGVIYRYLNGVLEAYIFSNYGPAMTIRSASTQLGLALRDVDRSRAVNRPDLFLTDIAWNTSLISRPFDNEWGLTLASDVMAAMGAKGWGPKPFVRTVADAYFPR